jgi:hypothetical protein
MIDEYRTTLEWYWQGKINIIGEIPVLAPICPPRIPHGMPRTQTQVSAARCRQLTARAMACRTRTCLRPFCNQRWLGGIQNQRIKNCAGDNWPEGKVHHYRSWAHRYRQRRNLVGSRGIASDLYSGDVGFESRSGQRLYWLRHLGFSSNLPSKGPVSTIGLKLGHKHYHNHSNSLFTNTGAHIFSKKNWEPPQTSTRQRVT